MFELLLPGLDGVNPLGFLAALGVLNAVTGPGPRLGWRGSIGVLAASADICGRQSRCAHRSPRRRPGECVRLCAGARLRGQRDLKPPPGRFPRVPRPAVAGRNAGESPQRRLGKRVRYGCGCRQQGEHEAHRSPLLCGAAAVPADGRGVGQERDQGRPAGGDWWGPGCINGRCPSWDGTRRRRATTPCGASDPSTDKKLGVPGADWLAIRGLSFRSRSSGDMRADDWL